MTYSKTDLMRPSKPKNLGPAPIHDGQHHVSDGVRTFGISRTELARVPVADGPDALEPDFRNSESPKQRTVPITPGMRSRTSACDDALHAARGAAMIEEALKCAGPDHPQNIARRLKP